MPLGRDWVFAMRKMEKNNVYIKGIVVVISYSYFSPGETVVSIFPLLFYTG